jgi:hypothetical protein
MKFSSILAATEWIIIHKFMAQWLIITGSGLNGRIYYQPLLQFLLIAINFSAIAYLPISQIIRTRWILVLVLRCSPLHSVLSRTLFYVRLFFGTDPTEKIVFCYQECVFIRLLPSNEYPSIVESVTPEMCLPRCCLAMGICTILFMSNFTDVVTVSWHRHMCQYIN